MIVEISMNMSKLSVLYIASRPPFPITGGREKVIAQGIEFLARKFDVHVMLFQRSGESVEVASFAKMGCKTIKVIPLPGIFEILYNIVTRRKKSLQENLYFSKRAKNEIQKSSEKGIDIVVADMLRTGQFCETIQIPKIIDLDDLLSNRYRQFLESKQQQAVFGTFGDRVPKALSMLEPYARRWLLKIEMARIGRRELESLRQFDAALLTSDLEVEALRRSSGLREIFSNPQATQITTESWIPPAQKENSVPCFFIGNLKTSQNFAALVYMVECVAPEMKRRCFEPIFHVVGTYDERTERLVAQRGNIVLHGFVADYTTVTKDCVVSLMPITEGTGIKTKVLDVMALGMPIVTNDKGAEGLSVVDGRELLIGKPSALIGVSKRIVDIHAQFAPVQLPSVVTHVYNGVDIKAHVPEMPERPDQFTVGFLGRISDEKGVPQLIKALTSLTARVRLIIGGRISDEEMNMCMELANGVEIEFLGFTTPENVLSRVHYLVVPSLWEEPFSRVVIESYAHGVPVIASKRGGMPEIIEEGKTGYLFEPEKENDLIRVLNVAANSGKEWQVMSGECHKYAQSFSAEIVTDRYIDIYDAVIEKVHMCSHHG